MDKKVKRTRRPGVTCISAKHQITLPVAAMKAADVHVGDELFVRVESDGRLVLQREENRVDRWIGAFPGLAANVNIDELRDEWER